MNQVITNAPLINPRGWGTLNFNDSTKITLPDTIFQTINVTFDSLITVRQIVLKNDLPATITPGNSNVRITNNGASVTGFTVSDSARGNNYEKILRVTLGSAIQIGPRGTTILVGTWHSSGVTDNPVHVVPIVFALSDSRIGAGRPIHYSIAASGPVVIDLLAINGVKIGTVFRGTVSAGSHTAVWNSRRIGSGVGVLRLISRSGVISKVVYIGK
jgi:hypothetical protein